MGDQQEKTNVHKPVRVVIVTDGDQVARKAVETAAHNVGARCISASAGNPTALSGPQLLQLIRQAPHDPVVVMLDDKGFRGQGKGESLLTYLAQQPGVHILGALAVASNTLGGDGAHVHYSIDSWGKIIPGPVDKNGRPYGTQQQVIRGDTVEVLDQLNLPVVVGIGDVGKMNGADDYVAGAPLTTKALRQIIEGSG